MIGGLSIAGWIGRALVMIWGAMTKNMSLPSPFDERMFEIDKVKDARGPLLETEVHNNIK